MGFWNMPSSLVIATVPGGILSLFSLLYYMLCSITITQPVLLLLFSFPFLSFFFCLKFYFKHFIDPFLRNSGCRFLMVIFFFLTTSTSLIPCRKFGLSYLPWLGQSSSKSSTTSSCQCVQCFCAPPNNSNIYNNSVHFSCTHLCLECSHDTY